MNAVEQALLDGAVRGVLSAIIADYARGRVDRQDVLEMAGRRREQIRDTFLAANAVSVEVSCAACAAAVLPADTATIAGRCYCLACAPNFRRARPVMA